MSRSKTLASMLLLAALLVLQVGAVLAAPAVQQSNPITGTVQSITIEADPGTGVTTVLVTLVNSAGNLQTVRLGVEMALALGLIILDPATGVPEIDDTAIGTTVSIDPGTVIPSGSPVEGKRHPVGSALANFFSGLLGVNYEIIMQYHEDGVGFGVLAQALWLTEKLEGDSEVFAAILDARRSGDYSAITMPDGSTPRNWGQFRKALLAGDKKANLGMIMSGRAGSSEEGATTVSQNRLHGHSNGNGHGNGNSHGKNKDHSPRR